VGDVIHHFKATDLQLHDDSNNIRFIFHFLVPETHKAACEIRDWKKKTQTSRGEKNEAIICRNCLPHHKRASSFMNMYKAARLHFLRVVEI
jgi:hypothetical protein